MGGLRRQLDQPQDRRMERVVEMSDIELRTVDRERIHAEIVGADRKELGLGRERLCRQGCCRCLDHRSQERWGLIGHSLSPRARISLATR